jgi:hypothetical protein
MIFLQAGRDFFIHNNCPFFLEVYGEKGFYLATIEKIALGVICGKPKLYKINFVYLILHPKSRMQNNR